MENILNQYILKYMILLRYVLSHTPLILDELDKLEIIDLLEKAIKYKLDIDIDSTPIAQISIEEKICDLYHRKKEESFY
jgi:hypothetical protein